MDPAVDSGWKGLHRVSGVSGLLFGAAYLIIIGLYVPLGAPPSGAQARLEYVAANIPLWWWILSLSVLTDFLLVPIAFSLYLTLKDFNKSLMLMGTALVLLFVILDLVLTWPNYAAIIVLSGQYAAADAAGRAAMIIAATVPAITLESTLLYVYNTFSLSAGILLIGIVMRKGIFSKTTAYLGIATGVLGMIAVLGPFVWDGLSATIIFASLLTMIWTTFAGYRLYRLGS